MNENKKKCLPYVIVSIAVVLVAAIAAFLFMTGFAQEAPEPTHETITFGNKQVKYDNIPFVEELPDEGAVVFRGVGLVDDDQPTIFMAHGNAKNFGAMKGLSYGDKITVCDTNDNIRTYVVTSAYEAYYKDMSYLGSSNGSKIRAIGDSTYGHSLVIPQVECAAFTFCMTHDGYERTLICYPESDVQVHDFAEDVVPLYENA